jgi:hypothetical protein
MMTQDELEGQEVVLVDGRVGRVVYSQHPAIVSGNYLAVLMPWGIVAVSPDKLDESALEQ